MRLLQRDQHGSLSLMRDISSSNDIPPYAILSHTWSPHDDDEVDLQDILKGSYTTKPGYKKLLFCVEQAAKDGLAYSWVDTCCINRASEPEVSESIRSMYRWYRKADKCYIYLSDVHSKSSSSDDEPSTAAWNSAFMNSRWFSRGWTLQELLAPKVVEFFSAEGENVGDKHSLERLIQKRTDIPLTALRGRPPQSFSVSSRLSWSQGRQTKRDEDIIYALLGLFDVHIPILYGEGKASAQKKTAPRT